MSEVLFSYRHFHRIRYRECDPMGILYHTHYLDIFEAARTEGLRSLGLAYKTLEDHGIMITVVDVSVSYKRPCFYDELIAVDTHFMEGSSLRIPVLYEVRETENESIRATGKVTLCCIDAQTRRPIQPPQMLLDVFRNAPENQSR